MLLSPQGGNMVGLLVTDSSGLIMSGTILIIKLHNMLQAKKLNIKELEYYETYIRPIKISNKINRRLSRKIKY